MLTVAAEALDRRDGARKILAKKGTTFTTKNGTIRVRPEVSIERDSGILFLRSLRELNLMDGAPEPSFRPSPIGGGRGRRR